MLRRSLAGAAAILLASIGLLSTEASGEAASAAVPAGVAVVPASVVETIGPPVAAGCVTSGACVVLGGLTAGFGLGYAGVQTYAWGKNQFFTDHPTFSATPLSYKSSILDYDVLWMDYYTENIHGRQVEHQTVSRWGDLGISSKLFYSDGTDALASRVGTTEGNDFTGDMYWRGARPGGSAPANILQWTIGQYVQPDPYQPGYYLPPKDADLDLSLAPVAERLITTAKCQYGYGGIRAVERVSDMWVGSGGAPEATPATGCPAGGSLVGLTIDHFGKTSTNILTWEAPSEVTNVSSQYKYCLGMSGGTICSLRWTNRDGIDVPETESEKFCRWGGYFMPDSDCTAQGNETAPSPSPSPSSSPSPTITDEHDVCQVPTVWHWRGEQHTEDRHIEGGPDVDDYSSIWGVPDSWGKRPYVSTEYLQDMMAAANGTEGRLQASTGNCIRTKGAGELIGTLMQKQGGGVTSDYSVIYKPQSGELISMYPGYN